MLKNEYTMKLGVSILLSVVIFIFCFGIKNNNTKLSFAEVRKEISRVQPEEVIQLYKEGKIDSALKLAKEYLTYNPDDVSIINILTEIYINKNDLSAAEEVVKKGIAIQQNNSWSRRLLASIYRRREGSIDSKKSPEAKSNNLTLALEQVKIGLGFKPNDAWLLAEAAQIYLEQGDKNKANEAIESALNVEPQNDYFKNIKKRIQYVP